MIILIQARSTSKRFPEKIFKEIKGKALIDYALSAAIQTGIYFCVVIPKNDIKLIRYLEDRNINYFQGDEFDVLDRFYQCARLAGQNTIIRLCADTLYTKEDILEQIELYDKRGKFTYGNGVFVMSFNELKEAWKYAKGDQREHVTTYLYHCVDYPEDIKKWQKES